MSDVVWERLGADSYDAVICGRDVSVRRDGYGRWRWAVVHDCGAQTGHATSVSAAKAACVGWSHAFAFGMGEPDESGAWEFYEYGRSAPVAYSVRYVEMPSIYDYAVFVQIPGDERGYGASEKLPVEMGAGLWVKAGEVKL